MPELSAGLVCSLLCHCQEADFICFIFKQRFSFPLLKVTKLVNIPSSPPVLLKINPYKHQHSAPDSGWAGLRHIKGSFQKFGLRCEIGKGQWCFMSSVSVLSEKSDCRASPDPAYIILLLTCSGVHSLSVNPCCSQMELHLFLLSSLLPMLVGNEVCRGRKCD